MVVDQHSLTPPLFIEVPVQSRESARSCICVLGVTKDEAFKKWPPWYHFLFSPEFVMCIFFLKFYKFLKSEIKNAKT